MAGVSSNTGNNDGSERPKGPGDPKMAKQEMNPASVPLGTSLREKGESASQKAAISGEMAYDSDPARRAPALQNLSTVPDSLEAHQTPFNTPIAQSTLAALPSSLNPVSARTSDFESAAGSSIPKSHRAPYNGKDNVQDYAPERLDEILTVAGFSGEPEGAPQGTHSAAHWPGRDDWPKDSLSGTDLSTRMDIDVPRDSEGRAEPLNTLHSPGSTNMSSAPRERDFDDSKMMPGTPPLEAKEQIPPISITRKPVASATTPATETPKDSEPSLSGLSSPLKSSGTPLIWGDPVLQTRRWVEGDPQMSLDSIPSTSPEQTGLGYGRSGNASPITLPRIDYNEDGNELLSIAAQMEEAMGSYVGGEPGPRRQASSPIPYLRSEEDDSEVDIDDFEASLFVHPIEREDGDGLGAHRILRGEDHPARVGSGQPIPLETSIHEQQQEKLASKRKLEEKMKLLGHKIDPEIEKSLRTQDHPAIKAFRQYATTRQDIQSVQLGLAAMNEALEDGLKVTAQKLSAEQSILMLKKAAQKAVDMVRKLSAEKHARQKADKDDPNFQDRDKEITELRKQLEQSDNEIRNRDAQWKFQLRQLEGALRDGEDIKNQLDICLDINRNKDERINQLQSALARAHETTNLSDGGGGDNESPGGSTSQLAGLETERMVLQSIVSDIQATSREYSHAFLMANGSLVSQFQSVEYYIETTLQQFREVGKEMSDARKTLDQINSNFGFERILNVRPGQLQSAANFRYKYHTLSEIINELVLRIHHSRSEPPIEEKERHAQGDQPATVGRGKSGFERSRATLGLEEELEATKTKLAKMKTSYKGIEPEVYHELEDMLKQEKDNVKSLEKQLSQSTTLVDIHRKDATQLRQEVESLNKEVKLGEEIHQHDKAQSESDIAKLKKLLEKLRAEKAIDRERGYYDLSVERKPSNPSQIAIEFALIRCDSALRAMVNKRLVFGFEYGDSEEAIEAALLAVKLSEKRRDEGLTARSNFWAGVAYYYSDDLGNAMLHFKNAQKGVKWREPQAERRMLDLWLQGGANLPVPKDAGYYGGKAGSHRRSLTDPRDINMRRRRRLRMVKRVRRTSSGSLK